MTAPIGHTTRLHRNDELMAAPVDDDIVFLNPATNNYVALDGIGRRIWELLAEPRTLGELVTALRHEFEGAPETIADDLRTFIAELVSEGMIRLDAAGP